MDGDGETGAGRSPNRIIPGSAEPGNPRSGAGGPAGTGAPRFSCKRKSCRAENAGRSRSCTLTPANLPEPGGSVFVSLPLSPRYSPVPERPLKKHPVFLVKKVPKILLREPAKNFGRYGRLPGFGPRSVGHIMKLFAQFLGPLNCTVLFRDNGFFSGTGRIMGYFFALLAPFPLPNFFKKTARKALRRRMVMGGDTVPDTMPVEDILECHVYSMQKQHFPDGRVRLNRAR